MKSEWRVTYRKEGMATQYCLYRLLDISIADHPGNREYARNWFLKKEIAEEAAAELNAPRPSEAHRPPAEQVKG